MKKIFIIVVLSLVCSWITGIVLDRSYKKFWKPFVEKLEVVLNDTGKRDIVFLGDSRTHQGIHPFYIDSAAQVNSYNAAMGGASINEIYFIADAWLNRHRPPKLFVVSVPFSGILECGNKFENTCQYLFFLDNPMVKKALSDQHYHTNLIKAFPILKYTAFDDFNKNTIFRSFAGETFLQPEGVAYKGFVNNNRKFISSTKKFTGPTDTAITCGLEKFNDLLLLFKKYNCKCIITYPPVMDKDDLDFPVFNKIDTAIATMGRKYKFPVFRFDNDSSFNKQLFEDPWHLNLKGSVQYSISIGKKIKTVLDNIW
jgi:hypothetical protein